MTDHNPPRTAREYARSVFALSLVTPSKEPTYDALNERARYDGLEEVRKVPGYHDEPLKGDQAGERSIRLSRSYRCLGHEASRVAGSRRYSTNGRSRRLHMCGKCVARVRTPTCGAD